MDQVIDIALLSAPQPETESESQEEQVLAEPRPLQMDQRVAGNRDQTQRLPVFPVDEQPEGDIDESDPTRIIIPQVDRISHDSYPNLRAKEADTHGS